MASDELVTPFDVEREMVALNNRLDEAPAVIREYHERLREARKQYKRKYNLAFAAAMGNQMDRRVAAEMAAEAEADAVDLAEIEYRYVCDTLDALKTKLRALQSVSSLIKAQMFNPQGGI